MPVNSVRQRQALGPLQELLIRACPPAGRGREQSIPILARRLNISANAIYKWIRANRLPAGKARRVFRVAGGRIELDELQPFTTDDLWSVEPAETTD